ncbi:uncharacterized protein BJ212DRAFT_1289521, partial [Suillus subaureus]
KIGTIQRRLAWPLHKDDTLSRSGRPTGLNIYYFFFQRFVGCSSLAQTLCEGWLGCQQYPGRSASRLYLIHCLRNISGNPSVNHNPM